MGGALFRVNFLRCSKQPYRKVVLLLAAGCDGRWRDLKERRAHQEPSARDWSSQSKQPVHTVYLTESASASLGLASEGVAVFIQINRESWMFPVLFR